MTLEEFQATRKEFPAPLVPEGCYAEDREEGSYYEKGTWYTYEYRADHEVHLWCIYETRQEVFGEIHCSYEYDPSQGAPEASSLEKAEEELYKMASWD